jgi:protein SCO1/2
MLKVLATAALIGLAMIAPLRAEDQQADALATSQRVIGNPIPALTFTNIDGQPVALSSLRGKPVLLTLIYTGCADVCPAVIESLAPAVAAAEEALGEGSFTVVTIGFDTRNDTPARMRSFARQHNAGGPNWLFLASTTETMEQLTQAVGFSFFSSAGGFDHMAQITVIDKQGIIYRQVYGSTFDTPQIVEPLKDLVFSREKSFLSVDGLIDRVKLFCTVYDPYTGRYYFNYSLFASILIGAVSLGLVLYALVRETRKSMQSRGT